MTTPAPYPPGPKTRLPGRQFFAFRRNPLTFLLNLTRDCLTHDSDDERECEVH